MLAGVSGGVLLVALFLPWYRFGKSGPDYTGWESFSALDVLLAVVAAMAIGLALMTAVQPTAAVSIALASLLALVGLVASGLTAARVCPMRLNRTSPYSRCRRRASGTVSVAEC